LPWIKFEQEYINLRDNQLKKSYEINKKKLTTKKALLKFVGIYEEKHSVKRTSKTPLKN